MIKINTNPYTINYSKKTFSQPGAEKAECNTYSINDLSKIPYYQISFNGALKNNLRIGEAVLKDFQQEFGEINSSTKLLIKIKSKQNNPLYQYLTNDLASISIKLGKIIKAQRQQIKGTYPSFDKYIEKMIKIIHDTNNSANCGECADITQHKLLKRNIEAHNIALFIKDIKSGEDIFMGEHAFTVIGLKKRAIFEDPKTWGNNAVIVDSWAKICAPAHEGIEQIKQLFGFDGERHEIEWAYNSIIDVNLYLENQSGAIKYKEKVAIDWH